MEDHGQPYTGRLLHADDWDSGGRDPYWPNLVLPLDSDRHPNNDNNKCFFNAAKPKWAWSLPPPVTDARSQVRDGKGVRMSMLPMSRDEVAGLSLVDDCVNEDADTRTVFAHLIKVGTHVRRSEAENLTALDGNDLPIPRCVAFNTVTDTVTESTQQGQPIEPRVECLRMTWIEGQNLKKVFTTMSRTEKMDVARQVIAFMHKLSNVPQHPDYPGIHLSLRTYRPVLKVREGDILQQWGPAKPWSPAVRKSLMLNLFTLRQPVFRTYASFVQGLEDWIIDLFEWHRPINHYSTMGDLAARLAHHITTNLRPTAWSLQPVATHGYVQRNHESKRGNYADTATWNSALSLGNFLVKDGKIVGVTDWSTAGFFPRYWEHFRMLSYIQDAKVSSPDVEFLCQVLYVSNGDWRALYAISYLHRLLVRGPFDGLDNHKFYCLEGRQLELYLIACHVGSRVSSHLLKMPSDLARFQSRLDAT